MHGFVVEVGGDRLVEGSGDEEGRIAFRFLLVANEMLHACNNVLLHPINSLVDQLAGKIWVVTEARSEDFSDQLWQPLRLDTVVLTLPSCGHLLLPGQVVL